MEASNFKNTWDPRIYYEKFSSSDIKSSSSRKHRLVERMHFIFGKQDPIPNGSLLDFGCGPIVANVIAASRVYKNIYMADYVDKSCEEITKWINNEPGCMDYTLVCELTSQKEANGTTPENIEDRVRSSIKAVIPCDILQDDPLLGSDCPRDYDAVIASHVVRVPCQDFESYKKGIKKLANLLKPNGILVMVVNLHETIWESGGHKYPVLSLDEIDVRQAIQEAGLHSGDWFRNNLSLIESTGNGSETVTFAAKKQLNCMQ